MVLSHSDLNFARLTALRWKLDLDNYTYHPTLHPSVKLRSLSREERLSRGFDWSQHAVQQIFLVKQGV